MSEMQEIRAWMMVTSGRASANHTVFTMGDTIRRDPRWKNAVEMVGPFNLAIQVTGESLEDIYEQLKEIAEFDVVGSMTTYVVVRCCDVRERRRAASHIIIDTRSEDAEEVWRQLQSFPEIVQVDIVLGAIDIIAVTDIPLDGLSNLITKIRLLRGVLRTVTMLALERSESAAF